MIFPQFVIPFDNLGYARKLGSANCCKIVTINFECVWFLNFALKPGEGKEDFQAKPCQSTGSRDHLTARVCLVYTGLGALSPFHLCCVVINVV